MPEHSGIFYTDQGKGFPVIFLHGFCETHEIWNSFSSQLSKNYRILCLDLPGFGRSNLLPAEFSIADVASNILAFLDALKIESCMVIGHSLGGYVTLEMAEQRPAILKAFGLFHSTAYPDAEEKKISRNKVIEFVTRHGVAPFAESFIPPLFYDQSNKHIPAVVELASTTPQTTLIAYVKAMRDRSDRTDVLKNSGHHILIIAGEKDSGITPESIRKQANLAQNTTLLMLQDVAHMGMFEQEELAIRQVNKFLRDRSPDFR